MDSSVWSNVNYDFKKRVFSGRVINNENIVEPKQFLNKCLSIVFQKVRQFMKQRKSPIKLNCGLACKYTINKNGVEEMVKIFHNSKMTPVAISDNFEECYSKNVYAPILKNICEYQKNVGDKALRKIMYLQVYLFLSFDKFT